MHDLVRSAQQLAGSELGAVGQHQSQMIRIGLRQCPEAEVGHSAPPSFLRRSRLRVSVLIDGNTPGPASGG